VALALMDFQIEAEVHLGLYIFLPMEHALPDADRRKLWFVQIPLCNNAIATLFNNILYRIVYHRIIVITSNSGR
jgi:hypothetical protein